MAAPTFSVIITTYNRPALLLAAVQSVLFLEERNWELLIVDDSSPGGLPDLPADDRITVIERSENGGASAARNTGIEASRGKFVTFLDDDDMFRKPRLSIDGLLDESPVLTCWSVFDNGLPAPAQRVLDGNVHDTILDDHTPVMGATIVDRQHLLPFDESYFAVEDIEWWLRTSAVCNVSTLPEQHHILRQHTGERHLNGLPERIGANRKLLDENRAYFADHPKAAGFRLWRMGSMSMTMGENRSATRYLMRSLVARPRPGTVRRLFAAGAKSITGRD